MTQELEFLIRDRRENNGRIIKRQFQIIGCDTARSNEILRPSMTYWQDAWRRLKQNKVAILSLCILIIITIMAIIGPALGKAISGVGYEVTNNDLLNQGPNAKNWFGTDMFRKRYLWKSLARC